MKVSFERRRKVKVLNWYLDNDFLSSEFKVFKPVTLYFLSTGRTAWRGAWSEQYRSGSALFSNLKEAKQSAELRRSQGTKFEIEQVPGLAFYSLEGVVACVEFHSSPPYKNLKISKISESIKIGTPLIKVIAPFARASHEFWDYPFPSKSSFISVKADLTTTFESLVETSPRVWKSMSWGINYALGWGETNKRELTPIERVLEEFKMQNDLIEIRRSENQIESEIRMRIKSDL
jgi:hypothetical protein